MEKIIWVIGDDRLEMIEAQRRINAAGSMRALCLLSFEAVQKAALAQEEGERSRISTPSLIIFDYQMAKEEVLQVFFSAQAAVTRRCSFVFYDRKTQRRTG